MEAVETTTEAEPQTRTLELVPANLIQPYPGVNPRRHFDATKLQELTDSVRVRGVLEPVLVHRLSAAEQLAAGGARYWLIAGERRWRAAINVGPHTIVPAMVGEYSHAEAVEIALVENIDRADLTPVEEARGYRGLVEAGWSQERIAERFGRSQEHVSNRMRLLQLPDEMLALIDEGLLAASHARDYLLPFVNIPAKARKQIYAEAEKCARQTMRSSGSAVRGHEIEQKIGEVARSLSKPVSSMDGVTPLMTPKEHDAECACSAPQRFRYRVHDGKGTLRCFDHAWWDRTQNAKRRERQKARDAEKRKAAVAEPNSPSTEAAPATKTTALPKYYEFQREYGYDIEALGIEALDVTKLDGAKFMLVDGWTQGERGKFVLCTDEKKYQAAVDALHKERVAAEAAVAARQEQEARATAFDIRMLTTFLIDGDVPYGITNFMNQSGPAGKQVLVRGPAQKEFDALSDDELKYRWMLLAIRARDEGGDGEDPINKVLMEKYGPTIEAFRKQIMAQLTAKKKLEPKPDAKKAARKQSAGGGRKRMRRDPPFMSPLQPDATLAVIVGEKPLPRTDVTKKIWAYIKKNGLQDEKERRMINADATLQPLFDGKDRVSMFEMTKFVNKHLTPTVGTPPANRGRGKKELVEA